MKRVLFSGLFFILIVFLSACGGGATDTSGNAEESQESASSEDSSNQDQDSFADSLQKSSGVYFDDGVAEIDDAKIEIKDTKVIHPDDLDDDDTLDIDGPAFAIWYEVTNKGDEPYGPGTLWTAVFDAVQDNDPDMVNELDSVGLAENDHYDKQMDKLKPGGTTEFSEVYALDDEETPVTLIAHKGIAGKNLGKEEYKIN